MSLLFLQHYWVRSVIGLIWLARCVHKLPNARSWFETFSTLWKMVRSFAKTLEIHSHYSQLNEIYDGRLLSKKNLMMAWWWCLQVQLRLDSLVIPIGTHQVIKANRKWWMATKAMMMIVSADSVDVWWWKLLYDFEYVLLHIPLPHLLKRWTFPNLCVHCTTFHQVFVIEEKANFK